MRFRTLLLTCVAVAIGSPISAQTTTKVKITAPTPYPGGEVTSYGYYPAGTPNFYVSPYLGLVDYNTATGTGQTVLLNCVDYFHDVNLGDVWEVKQTNLGAVAGGSQNLSATRWGGLSNSLTLYKQAAWLTMQYDSPNPGADPNETRAIQSAIWNLFSAAPAPTYAGSNNEWVTSWWITQSVAGGASLTTADLASFSILSDDHMYPSGSDRQEFLVHTTPEPATLALAFTGFAGLAGMVRRKTRKGDDSSELAS